jgi:hypothetical protein
MPEFNVTFQRVEYYTVKGKVYADSREEAQRKAEDMLESGDVSFDRDVVSADETVVLVAGSQNESG